MFTLSIWLTTASPLLFAEAITTSAEECTQLGELYTDKLNALLKTYNAVFECKKI